MTRAELLKLPFKTDLVIHDAFSEQVSSVIFTGRESHTPEYLNFAPPGFSHLGTSGVTFSLRETTITDEFAALCELESDYNARQKLSAKDRKAAERTIETAKKTYLKSLVVDRKPLKRKDFESLPMFAEVFYCDPLTHQIKPLTFIGQGIRGAKVSGFRFVYKGTSNSFDVSDHQMNDQYASLFSLDSEWVKKEQQIEKERKAAAEQSALADQIAKLRGSGLNDEQICAALTLDKLP